MKKAKSKSNGKAEEFDKFERLTKALIAVPKSEIDKKKVEHERNKPKRKVA